MLRWKQLSRTHLQWMSKGAPARESRTGTWLVSPTPGCEKKGYLWNKASERKIEYTSTLEILLVSTDTMVSGTTPGNSLKPDSE